MSSPPLQAVSNEFLPTETSPAPTSDYTRDFETLLQFLEQSTPIEASNDEPPTKRRRVERDSDPHQLTQLALSAIPFSCTTPISTEFVAQEQDSSHLRYNVQGFGSVPLLPGLTNVHASHDELPGVVERVSDFNAFKPPSPLPPLQRSTNQAQQHEVSAASRTTCTYEPKHPPSLKQYNLMPDPDLNNQANDFLFSNEEHPRKEEYRKYFFDRFKAIGTIEQTIQFLAYMQTTFCVGDSTRERDFSYNKCMLNMSTIVSKNLATGTQDQKLQTIKLFNHLFKFQYPSGESTTQLYTLGLNGYERFTTAIKREGLKNTHEAPEPVDLPEDFSSQSLFPFL